MVNINFNYANLEEGPFCPVLALYNERPINTTGNVILYKGSNSSTIIADADPSEGEFLDALVSRTTTAIDAHVSFQSKQGNLNPGVGGLNIDKRAPLHTGPIAVDVLESYANQLEEVPPAYDYWNERKKDNQS